MTFLTPDECKAWLRKRGLDHIPPGPGASRPQSYEAYEFRIPHDAGARVALCRQLWRECGDQARLDRLLVMTGWSVWPSGEHLPLFTRLRERFDERRPLIGAPGHLFTSGDEDDGLSFLVLATMFLWDYRLYAESGVIMTGSNDEVGAVYEPKDRRVPDLRRALERLDVLV
ncbi:MAG TPA: hypothetical protein VJN96_13665 [Vicinamibacterales bacterium]|nr:hypothetical protein [Vicinamibacterales bacterium]